MLYDSTYIASRMVTARGMVSYLMGIEFQFYTMKRVLQIGLTKM